MAKALERGESDLTSFLTKLDRTVLGDAKRKVEMKAQETGRDNARALNVPFWKKGKGVSKGKFGKEPSKDGKATGPRSRSPKRVPWATQKGRQPANWSDRPKPSWETNAGNLGKSGGGSGKGNGKRSW